MSVLAIIALVFGVAGVLFTIIQNIWCWPLALISVVASTIEFYEERLYGDMALQLFYFGAGLYGWFYWNRNKTKQFKVEFTPASQWYILIGITILQAIVYYFIIKKLRGDQAVFDSILTAASITTTYMMTKKWLENWIIWVVIDLAYVVLYGIKGMGLFAILYFVFALMAVYGFIRWRKMES